jgi:hypothetical protein
VLGPNKLLFTGAGYTQCLNFERACCSPSDFKDPRLGASGRILFMAVFRVAACAEVEKA